MAQLLAAAATQRIMPGYTAKLLEAFAAEEQKGLAEPQPPDVATAQLLVEPLSPREVEILQLVAEGLSNREIGARLYLAGQILETEQVFAILIVLAMLGIIVTKVQDAVDAVLGNWRVD